MRTSPDSWRRLDLRAHTLLADAPLHDVWSVDLPGGGPGRTVVECREMLSIERIARSNPIVRGLFALRTVLGRLLGWDRQPEGARTGGSIERLSPAERDASIVPPGTADGPFTVVCVNEREWISEVRNATVHAFSVFALVEQAAGYRLYMAIYVIPVGRITVWYMRLIDPFRRWIVYPALLRSIHAAWCEMIGGR